MFNPRIQSIKFTPKCYYFYYYITKGGDIMSFFTNLAKDIGRHMVDKLKQMQQWQNEAALASDEELVRTLNRGASGPKLNIYIKEAKERGTIGRRGKTFYVR